MCNVKDAVCSDNRTEDHHLTAVPLSSVDLFSIFQLIVWFYTQQLYWLFWFTLI